MTHEACFERVVEYAERGRAVARGAAEMKKLSVEKRTSGWRTEHFDEDALDGTSRIPSPSMASVAARRARTPETSKEASGLAEPAPPLMPILARAAIAAVPAARWRPSSGPAGAGGARRCTFRGSWAASGSARGVARHGKRPRVGLGVKKLAAFEREPESCGADRSESWARPVGARSRRRGRNVVQVTLEQLAQDDWGGPTRFECILCEAFDATGRTNTIGFAVYSFSTWQGNCLYLYDLFIEEPYRGSGAFSAHGPPRTQRPRRRRNAAPAERRRRRRGRGLRALPLAG
eukprot:CAMPEP_0184076516 /NCGR_PEP_ID=MMETSP0974-20121125/180_1 /TAXON_ID=483370 /ORGANISM="non described non described, Strain CCMP2097" /LENGTH=289 /DNA_ID=CAMNT_0026379061 /DNA_START=111 /DNA_END=979 /DNA_ORIENTATION=-